MKTIKQITEYVIDKDKVIQILREHLKIPKNVEPYIDIDDVDFRDNDNVDQHNFEFMCVKFKIEVLIESGE